MFPPEADRLGARAGSFCLVGLKRGRPRMMRSSEFPLLTLMRRRLQA